MSTRRNVLVNNAGVIVQGPLEREADVGAPRGAAAAGEALS